MAYTGWPEAINGVELVGDESVASCTEKTGLPLAAQGLSIGREIRRDENGRSILFPMCHVVTELKLHLADQRMSTARDNDVRNNVDSMSNAGRLVSNIKMLNHGYLLQKPTQRFCRLALRFHWDQ